jgi:phosphoglycolate phosphatase
MNLLIFDLDGTLIDSKLDLVHSVNAARNLMGLPNISEELVSSYVGNGAPVLLRRALGPDASDADVLRALEFFLGYYREHMLDNTCLYPGVKEALDHMQESGAKMAVLTNKPVRFSRAIIDGLGLGGHFFQVYGGDSGVDVRTARNARVLACGVSYGFQPESFVQDPPDILVDEMAELVEYIRNS